MRTCERGFSLMEAIVALVILSAGLVAAFSWFDRGLEALIRMDAVALEESAVQELVERLLVADLNAREQGQFQWLDYDVAWQSNLQEPARSGISSVGSVSYFDQMLYRIDARIHYRDRLIAEHSFLLQQDNLARRPPQ